MRQNKRTLIQGHTPTPTNGQPKPEAAPAPDQFTLKEQTLLAQREAWLHKRQQALQQAEQCMAEINFINGQLALIAELRALPQDGSALRQEAAG